ncbi:MAG: hypothetical protein FWD55_09060 [Propionibacteriaceae bacterium]|nr:hypothetical protein [Propionibacteriaceae bacterium]
MAAPVVALVVALQPAQAERPGVARVEPSGVARLESLAVAPTETPEPALVEPRKVALVVLPGSDRVEPIEAAAALGPVRHEPPVAAQAGSLARRSAAPAAARVRPE